jgi:hypothetical protein
MTKSRSKSTGSKASSRNYRNASNTKQRVAKSRKARAAKSAANKAYRSPTATKHRVSTSRGNGSGKSGPQIANKEHIGTTIGRAGKSLYK